MVFAVQKGRCKDRARISVAGLQWTEEEDKRLFEAYKEFGCRWSEIGRMFGSKSANQLKNRFYSTLRRVAIKNNRYDKKFNQALLQSKEYLIQFVEDALKIGHNCSSKRGRKRKNLFEITSTLSGGLPKVAGEEKKAKGKTGKETGESPRKVAVAVSRPQLSVNARRLVLSPVFFCPQIVNFAHAQAIPHIPLFLPPFLRQGGMVGGIGGRRWVAGPYGSVMILT